MLHSRQKRELPFWTGDMTEVLAPGMGEGWGATVWVTLSGRWEDPTVSLRISGTGDAVRKGALWGEVGRGDPADGEPADGDPPPTEGLPFTSGESGEVVPLLACPLMLSLCARDTSLG